MEKLEKEVFEKSQEEAREMRQNLMDHYRDWLKRKKDKKLTEHDNQNAMVHIKFIEAQGKSVMNDVHIGNLIHKQEKMIAHD